jgi:hypothetical protein
MSLQMPGTPIAGKSVFLILEDGLYLNGCRVLLLTWKEDAVCIPAEKSS